MMNVYDELHQRLKEHPAFANKDLVKFSVSWNETWLAKLNAMAVGVDRDAEMEKGIQAVIESEAAIARGDFTVLPGLDPD